MVQRRTQYYNLVVWITDVPPGRSSAPTIRCHRGHSWNNRCADIEAFFGFRVAAALTVWLLLPFQGSVLSLGSGFGFRPWVMPPLGWVCVWFCGLVLGFGCEALRWVCIFGLILGFCVWLSRSAHVCVSLIVFSRASLLIFTCGLWLLCMSICASARTDARMKTGNAKA